ncbi:MAG: LPS export ABC transporter permease LptG [Pseudomonadota bacterium]
MKTLAAYLLRTVLGATGLVLLVLLAVAGFIEFIGQLDDTGEGSYTTAGAALYTALRLPMLGVDMLPVATLLGALVGLGNLAGHSELIAMRAAGISARRLGLAVAVSGLLLAVGGAVIAEYIAPPLDQFARKYRTAARNRADLAGTSNTWVRDGRRVFNVERVDEQLQFGGVYVFEVESDQELAMVAYASRADLDPDGRWALQSFTETRFDGMNVSATSAPTILRDFNVDAELLGIAALRPYSLSVRGLLAYLSYLRANRLDARAYETELWSRVSDVLATVLMPMLAIGFVFGALRRSGTGARLTLGVLIGLAYFLASRTLANSGQVFALEPALVGLAPSAALAIATIIVLQRVR